MNPSIEAAIIDSKTLRKDIDEIIQRLRKAACYANKPSEGIVPKLGARSSRERSIALTKLQEAVMWLGMDLKAINEENPGAQENPYPNSKDPTNTKIDATADGLKL